MAQLTHTPSILPQAEQALAGKTSRRIGNNTNLVKEDTNIIATLHGNPIVRYTEDVVFASWAGYVTNTTRDRLNQLTSRKFSIKNGQPLVDGQPVSAYDWYEV